MGGCEVTHYFVIYPTVNKIQNCRFLRNKMLIDWFLLLNENYFYFSSKIIAQMFGGLKYYSDFCKVNKQINFS